MKHYNEVELLESAYLGGGTPEISEHLKACAECRQREIRLRAKLSCSPRAHEERVDAKPEFFWAKQRGEIARRLSAAPRGAGRRVWQLATAAVLALSVGIGVISVVNRDSESVAVSESVTPAAAEPEISVSEVPVTPWESETLEPYAGVVEWETWLDEEGKGTES